MSARESMATGNPRGWRCPRCGRCGAGYASESAAARAGRHHAEQGHPTRYIPTTTIEVDR